MSGEQLPQYTEVLAQLPLASLVVFVVLRFLNFLKEQGDAERRARSEDSTAFREFLREQRAAANEAVTNLAREVGGVTAEMAALKDTLYRPHIRRKTND